MKGKNRSLLHRDNALECARRARELYDLGQVDQDLDCGLGELIARLCYFAAEVCEYEGEEIAVYIVEGKSYSARELLIIAANQLDPTKVASTEMTVPTAIRLAIKVMETK